MQLNPDGSAIINGITLSAAQVEEIKEAYYLPQQREGWWVVVVNNKGSYSPVFFLGTTLASQLNRVTPYNTRRSVCVTGHDYVIIWGTF